MSFLLIMLFFLLGTCVWLRGEIDKFTGEIESYNFVKIVKFKESVEELPKPTNQTAGQVFLLDVSFTPQAPFGQWADSVYQNACEEATILMAINWVRGERISKEEASEEIKKITEFEDKNYGQGIYDRSAKDTAQLIRDYWGYENVEIRNNIGVKEIVLELEKGNLVIVPINGQVLKNPYYTLPGPAEHMILIIGYDFQTKEFITNDAGTRQGEKYRYDENRFYDSIRDYPTGYKEPILEIKKPMIVIKPNK